MTIGIVFIFTYSFSGIKWCICAIKVVQVVQVVAGLIGFNGFNVQRFQHLISSSTAI